MSRWKYPCLCMKARPCNTWQERGELRLTGHYLSHLEHHVPDHALGEQFISVVVPLLHHLVEVLLHVLEHEVESVILTDDLISPIEIIRIESE